MARAMERMQEISVFGLERVNLSRVPVNRLNTLARYGQLSKAQTIERAPEPKTALLTAVVRNLDAQAVDDALDLFALLMANRLINPARRASDKERLAVLPQLEKPAQTLARASKILVEELDQRRVRRLSQLGKTCPGSVGAEGGVVRGGVRRRSELGKTCPGSVGTEGAVSRIGVRRG